MFFHGFGLARVGCLFCLILGLAFFRLCTPLQSQSCPPQNLSQEFLERLPIVRFPSCRQVFRRAFRKTRMVKYDLGP